MVGYPWPKEKILSLSALGGSNISYDMILTSKFARHAFDKYMRRQRQSTIKVFIWYGMPLKYWTNPFGSREKPALNSRTSGFNLSDS